MSGHFALIIEDDIDVTGIFEDALDALGFTTEIVNSGRHAVDRLSEILPRVVVPARHLTEGGGPVSGELMGENQLLGATRVVVATADPFMAYLVRDMADVVVVKPATTGRGRNLAHA